MEEEEELYEVEDVVDSRIYHGIVQYRVRWANFSPKHDTWEPEENLLTCHDLIERYLAAKNSKSNSSNNSVSNVEDRPNSKPSCSNDSTSTNEDESKQNLNNNASTSDESNLFSNLIDAEKNFSSEITTPAENGNVNEELSEEDDENEEIDEEKNNKNEEIEEKEIRKTPSKRGRRGKRQQRWEYASLKDDFWKKLEKGDVDLSLGMYERVKRKRQAAVATSTPCSTVNVESSSNSNSNKRGKFRTRRQPKSKEILDEPDENNDSDDNDNDNDRQSYGTSEENSLLQETTSNVEEETSSVFNSNNNFSTKRTTPPTTPTKQKNGKTTTFRKINKIITETKIDEIVKSIVDSSPPKKLNAPKNSNNNNNKNDTNIVATTTKRRIDETKLESETDEDDNEQPTVDVKPTPSRWLPFAPKLVKLDKQQSSTTRIPSKNKESFNASETIHSTNQPTTVNGNVESLQTVNKQQSNVSTKLTSAKIESLSEPVVQSVVELVHESRKQQRVTVVAPEPPVPVTQKSVDDVNEVTNTLSSDIAVSTSNNIGQQISSSSTTTIVEPLLQSQQTSEPPVVIKPTGRWLPLAPKLVKKVTVDETNVATTSQAPTPADSSACVNGYIDSSSSTPNASSVAQPNVSSSINKQTERILKSPVKEPDKQQSAVKKLTDVLPMTIEEDLNVNDFFKSDMCFAQDDERQTARFLTNDDFCDASRDGNFEQVRSALIASKNFKCPYDLEALDVYGNTLLMSATLQKCDAWHSGDDVIEVLVQHGANLNACNREGDTALMLAITREHLCKVTKLLSLGAAVNLPNRCGETPLMVACVKGFSGIAHRLLEYGADFNASTTAGRTVANMASHSKAVTKVLQTHESKVKLSFEQELFSVVEPDKIKIKFTLFPMHCYALNESRTFRIMFNYTPFVLPRKHFIILVIGVAKFAQNLSVRFTGSSPVVSIVLNDIEQQAIQEDGRFIFTLCPLKAGANELLIKCAENSKMSQCKLLTTAFVVQVS